MLAVQHLLIRDHIRYKYLHTRSHHGEQAKNNSYLSAKRKRKSGAGESNVSISGGQETCTAAHLEEIRGNDSVCK